MKKKKELLQEKPKNYKLKTTFAIIILAALFLAELYTMINMPKNYIIIGVIALFMLCMFYIITDLVFKIQNQKDDLHEKQYENIFKSEKVSYIMMKQNFMEIEEILDAIKKNSDFPVEELIKAQKAVGKVTIQRSKENAEAIMNCNDKLLEKLIDFEVTLKEIHTMKEEKQSDVSNHFNEEIIAKQQEILNSVKKIEDSIKSEIKTLAKDMDEHISNIPVHSAGMDTMMSSEDIDKILNETTAMMDMMEMDHSKEPEAVISEEPMAQEAAIVPEEPVVQEEAVVPEEPVVQEEAVVPEEPVVQEEAVVPEEPIVPEQPVVSEVSDPGHIMTPEEIAALIGEVNTPEPEPVVEEKPPMPDLSDPGHVMTPEEIAALLANM